MRQLEFDWRDEERDKRDDAIVGEVIIKMNDAMAEDLLSAIKKILVNRKLTDFEDDAIGLLISSLTSSLKEE
jgi:hypothetical protein